MIEIAGRVDQSGHLLRAEHGRQSLAGFGKWNVLGEKVPAQCLDEQEAQRGHILTDRGGSQLLGSGTDEPDTAGFARARACPVAGENTPQNRGRCERRFLRYDGSNYDAGVLPASFGVVGSQGPPFSVTQLTSSSIPPPTADPRTRGSVRRASGFVQIAITLSIAFC